MNTRRLLAPTLFSCILSLSSILSAADQSEEGFVPYFNGKDFTGLTQLNGKAEFIIEDENTILGKTVVGEPNSFLATDKIYRNFIMELDVKTSDMNAGIQIRSNANPEETEAEVNSGEGKPKKRKIPAGRVHGYQVEVDPSDRAYSGGVYDEARRGWLYDLSGDKHAEARKAFKPGEWNHYKIQFVGDHLQTWINDVPCADLHDDLTAEGFIALQVHANKKGGIEVRYRNAKIKELPDDRSTTSK